MTSCNAFDSTVSSNEESRNDVSFDVESFDVSNASETERQFQITDAYPTDR